MSIVPGMQIPYLINFQSRFGPLAIGYATNYRQSLGSLSILPLILIVSLSAQSMLTIRTNNIMLPHDVKVCVNIKQKNRAVT